jgi:raffinose/stachyose/melibiose transport system permease protein
MSIFYSFTNWNGLSFSEFRGLANYRFIFTNDPDFWNSFLFTGAYTLVNTLMLNTCAVILAKILTSGVLGENKLRITFFLPNMLSIVVVGMIWQFIYGQLSNELFRSTGLLIFGVSWLTTFGAAVFSISATQTWAAIGWYTLIYITGYQSIPKELYEACDVDGCSGPKRFFKVTLPLLLPSITICLFTALVQGLQMFDLVYSMTSGGPGRMTETVVLNIFNTSFRNMFYGFGSAKTVVLSIVVMIVSFTQIILTRRKETAL